MTDPQADAIARVATFGTTVVTEGSNLARYVGRIVGTVPEDTVGLVIGDPLHAGRTLAAGWYDIKVREILERRRAKAQPVSLSVALPLVRGAYDESRDGLRERWAYLIANAMDPATAGRVRISFMETLKQFDPLDAVVLQARHEAPPGDSRPSTVDMLSVKLAIETDEILISVNNLRRLGCVDTVNSIANFHVLPYGRALLRACSD